TMRRLGRSLRGGGWLLVGASEVVHKEPDGLRLRPLGGRFGLQRTDEPGGARPNAVDGLGRAPPVGPGARAPGGPAAQPRLASDRAPSRFGWASSSAEARPAFDARASLSAEGTGPTPDREAAADAAIARALSRGHSSLEAGDARRAVELYAVACELD